MKHFLTFFLILYTFLTSFAQDARIYFDTASSEIRQTEDLKLRNMANYYFLGEHHIRLVGYTDKSGSEEYNLLLSQRRVNAIRDYFLSKGVPSAHIQTDYKGEKGTAEDDQNNRIVEIFMIRVSQTPVLELKKDVIVEEPRIISDHADVSEVIKDTDVISSRDFERMQQGWKMTYDIYMDSIMPAQQIHKLDNTKENIIKGEKGTWIKIPENAFVYENGELARGQIVVKLKEYYSKKDFIADRLSTISKGNLIKSAGMIHLEAKSMNYQLSLADDKKLEILFPKMEQKYSTFYGKRMEDGSMDWEIDEDYTRPQAVNMDDFGVTTTADGKGLELVDKEAAGERNKNAYFGGHDGELREVTDSMIVEAINDWKTKEKISTRLKSNNLGYINCDRFMDEKTSDVEILVEVTNNVKAIYGFLVFKELNSVIEITQQEKNIFFYNANLPLGKNVDLIIAGKDDTDGLYLYQHSFKLAAKNAEKIKLEKSSYEKLDEILSEM